MTLFFALIGCVYYTCETSEFEDWDSGGELFDDGEGLVVVDYKTDAVADDADRAVKARRYRLQGAAYAVAAQRASGLPVRRVLLCFLATDGATEVEVDDLAGAMDEVTSIARDLAGA